jgi:hypothetical protein
MPDASSNDDPGCRDIFYNASFVALLAQCLAEEMRTWAGFHPDQIDLRVRSEPKKLRAREFLPHHDLSRLAQSNKVENCLAQIDADRMQVYGKPPAHLYMTYSPSRCLLQRRPPRLHRDGDASVVNHSEQNFRNYGDTGRSSVSLLKESGLFRSLWGGQGAVRIFVQLRSHYVGETVVLNPIPVNRPEHRADHLWISVRPL